MHVPWHLRCFTTKSAVLQCRRRKMRAVQPSVFRHVVLHILPLNMDQVEQRHHCTQRLPAHHCPLRRAAQLVTTFRPRCSTQLIQVSSNEKCAGSKSFQNSMHISTGRQPQSIAHDCRIVIDRTRDRTLPTRFPLRSLRWPARYRALQALAACEQLCPQICKMHPASHRDHSLQNIH